MKDKIIIPLIRGDCENKNLTESEIKSIPHLRYQVVRKGSECPILFFIRKDTDEVVGQWVFDNIYDFNLWINDWQDFIIK